MIVYLDQNKWIELAQSIYSARSAKSPKTTTMLMDYISALEDDVIFPLSSIHYIEFYKISNVRRRDKLGSVMWNFSLGHTMAPLDDLLEGEIELGLSAIYPDINVRELKILGRGLNFALGVNAPSNSLPDLNEEFEKLLLTKNSYFNIPPASTFENEPREKFLSNLISLQDIRKNICKSKWEDWLYAKAFTDTLILLRKVSNMHRISQEQLLELASDKFKTKKFLESMPTSRLLVQLYRQILKNPNIKLQHSDLEDWGGIGVASCYCDVVVCEKHFADMLQRDKYKPHARIETELSDVFK